MAPQSQPLPQNIDFVIITALREELDAVLNILPESQQLAPDDNDIRTYHYVELPVTFLNNTTGKYHLIVMCLLGMGRVEAVAATSDAIRRWKPRYILMVGIAGGIAASNVQIGDILISHQIIDYELQKLSSDDPEIRWNVYRADPRLYNACINYRIEAWQEIDIKRPDAQKPKPHFGSIACGDKVIALNSILENYRKFWPGLLGVDMESSGAAAAVFQSANTIKFFMIRGVSDLADERKDSPTTEMWRDYACAIAASFTVNLLKSGPVPLLVKTKQAQLVLEGEFSEFTFERQQDFAKVLAAILKIDPTDIRILKVLSGSIVLVIEMPEIASDRLYKMSIDRDFRIRNLGVTSIFVDGLGVVQLTDKSSRNESADSLQKIYVVTGDGNIIGDNNIFVTNYNEVMKPLLGIPPRPVDHFVGRTNTFSSIVSILTQRNQYTKIAIVGTGGIGKTALAKQIAEHVKASFPGGVFWGDELPLNNNNPNIILRTWGKLCGQDLKNEAEESLPSIIRGLLSARAAEVGRILVIVDDARLDWTGEGIKAIVDALPSEIPLLLTTRQVQIAQEVSAEVREVDVLTPDEAIQLLNSLARERISAENARTIAELCGYMPLALELISKLAVTTNRQDWILKRLQTETNKLDFLKLDQATRKDQSVSISLGITYQALQEQYPNSARMFRYFAAFASPPYIGFRYFIDSIVQSKYTNIFDKTETNPTPSVINELSANYIEDTFFRLQNWSLLREDRTDQSTEMQYFSMHALLHDYTRSRLVDPEEIEAAARLQILYGENLANDVQRQERITIDFERSYGQLLQALVHIKEYYILKDDLWKNDDKLIRQIITLVGCLDDYWQNQKQFAEEIEWLTIASECASILGNPIKQADFLRRLGRALGWRGKLDEALDSMNQCELVLGADQSIDANSVRAQMYIHRTSIQYQKGDLEAAEQDCKNGLKLVSHQVLPHIYAEGSNLLGAIFLRRNHLADALELFKESLAVWKQTGDQYQVSRVEDNVRSTLYYLGDIGELRVQEEEGLEFWSQYPNSKEYAAALTNRGLIHYMDREYETAIRIHTQAIELSDSMEYLRLRALARLNLAWPLIATDELGEAERLLTESLTMQEENKIDEFELDTSRCLAEVQIRRNKYEEAIKIAQEVVALAEEEDDSLEQGAALRVLGQAQFFLGDLQRARQSLEKGLSILSDDNYKYETYLTMKILVDVYKGLQNEDNAERVEYEAKVLFEEMGLKPDSQ